MASQDKSARGRAAATNSRLASEILALRQELKISQSELGKRCGVSQVTVSRWEMGLDQPRPKALLELANLTNDGDRANFFLREGGLGERIDAIVAGVLDERARRASKKMSSSLARRLVSIPLYRDTIAAGSPRAVNDKDVDRELLIPQEWLPTALRSGKGIVALRVAGDSMAPIIEPGYVVLVDTNTRDPRRLLNKMVAAREDEGVTVKWLRKEGRYYQLVPQNTSLRNPVRILDEENEEKWGIVGEVVKWIGEPPPARGRR